MSWWLAAQTLLPDHDPESGDEEDVEDKDTRKMSKRKKKPKKATDDYDGTEDQYTGNWVWSHDLPASYPAYGEEEEENNRRSRNI